MIEYLLHGDIVCASDGFFTDEKLYLNNIITRIGWRPFRNAVLIGDSGYQSLSWLLTPNVPQDLPIDGSERFLRRHKSTRQLVERSIGLLKSKFPSLNYLRLKTPQKCCRIILACITLHNIERITKYADTSFDNIDMDDGIIDQNFIDADHVVADIVAQFEAE